MNTISDMVNKIVKQSSVVYEETGYHHIIRFNNYLKILDKDEFFVRTINTRNLNLISNGIEKCLINSIRKSGQGLSKP